MNGILAEAAREAKLSLIRECQTGGRLVATTSGINDAPTLAEADWDT